MVNAVSEDGPDSTTIKYLVKEHTFMAEDSVHGRIGTLMRKKESIYNFDDFIDICRNSGKTMYPICMNLEDFYKFNSGCRTRTARGQRDLPLLSDLCEVKFTKHLSVMQYKSSFTQEKYNECFFLRPNFDLFQLPEAIQEPRGLSTSKHSGIMKVMVDAATPSNKMRFWKKLMLNDEVADLVTHVD